MELISNDRLYNAGKFGPILDGFNTIENCPYVFDPSIPSRGGVLLEVPNIIVIGGKKSENYFYPKIFGSD